METPKDWNFDQLNVGAARIRQRQRALAKTVLITELAATPNVDPLATAMASIAAGEPVLVVETGRPANQAVTES